jgi:hypothetical protein
MSRDNTMHNPVNNRGIRGYIKDINHRCIGVFTPQRFIEEEFIFKSLDGATKIENTKTENDIYPKSEMQQSVVIGGESNRKLKNGKHKKKKKDEKKDEKKDNEKKGNGKKGNEKKDNEKKDQ